MCIQFNLKLRKEIKNSSQQENAGTLQLRQRTLKSLSTQYNTERAVSHNSQLYNPQYTPNRCGVSSGCRLPERIEEVQTKYFYCLYLIFGTLKQGTPGVRCATGFVCSVQRTVFLKNNYFIIYLC